MYKIMLVDDEDEVREGITATVDFAACGFTLCAQATGAIDAIEKAAQFQPDVVFTDVHMPYMDGMEMISRLQEMYPTMKYIVLSGYDDFIYVKQALQRQVLDYLLKPLSAQGIMKVLRRAKEQLDEQDRQRVNLEILRDKVAKNAQQLRRGVVLELDRHIPAVERRHLIAHRHHLGLRPHRVRKYRGLPHCLGAAPGGVISRHQRHRQALSLSQGGGRDQKGHFLRPGGVHISRGLLRGCLHRLGGKHVCKGQLLKNALH